MLQLFWGKILSLKHRFSKDIWLRVLEDQHIHSLCIMLILNLHLWKKRGITQNILGRQLLTALILDFFYLKTYIVPDKGK